MWLYCSGADSPDAVLPNVRNIVLYDYQNSRARSCPVAFLGDYDGYLQTNGYGVYDGLHRVTNVGGFAHARRKFMDAKKRQGKGLGLLNREKSPSLATTEIAIVRRHLSKLVAD